MIKNISLATNQNITALTNLAKACDCTKTPHKLVWNSKLFETFLQDKNSLVYVYNPTNPVGCLVAKFSPDYSKLHLYNLFVLPSCRNQHIAQDLLTCAKQQARLHGTQYICSLNSCINKYLIKLGFLKGKFYLWQDLKPFEKALS